MKKIFVFVTMVFLFLSLQAQIVLDSADFVQTVGQTWFVQCGGQITVDVGNPGGPHTWDFTSLSTLNDTDLYMIIEPSTAPAFDSFPTANVVELALYDNDSTLMYTNITSSEYILLGMEVIEDGYHFIMRIDSGAIPLPGHYQDSWRISTLDTILSSGDTVITIFFASDQQIDAYGTIIIPEGSYPCLRFRSDNISIMTRYIMSILDFSDTTVNIQYSWFAENYPQLLYIESPEGDTNPNFTIADYINLYAGFTTGVEEEPSNNNAINSIMLVKEIDCYYVSYTDIQLTEINIFDLAGRLNFTSEISGSGKLKLDLHNPGIYFITFDNSNTYQSDKLIIIK